MADEDKIEEGDNEEVSWEDAFKEAAAGSEEVAAEEPQAATPTAVADDAPEQPAQAMPADTSDQVAAAGIDIDFLLDISLEVTVEVGRTRMLINDLLQLQQGSVIDLEKMVGDPFEVYVNRKLMAFGEVVVVNEKFGIRLTDVIDPKERIAQLG